MANEQVTFRGTFGGTSVTEKGALSYGEAGGEYSNILKLFSKLNVDLYKNIEFESMIEGACKDDMLLTLKTLAHLRNVRGGVGARRTSKEMIDYLMEGRSDVMLYNMHNMPHYGRWSDVLPYLGHRAVGRYLVTELLDDIRTMESGDKTISLLGKWLPTEGSKTDKEKVTINEVEYNTSIAVQYWMNKCYNLDTRRHLTETYCGVRKDKICRKTYRKICVALRKRLRVLERYMCKGEWSDIDYEHVPGRANYKYREAFLKHDKERREEFLSEVKAGTKKLNASTVWPHEIVRKYMTTYYSGREIEVDDLLELQWNELVKETREYGAMGGYLVLSDVSGSMQGTPMEVSIALGLMISELTDERFRDLVLTFDTNPEFHTVKGDTLSARVHSLQNAKWGRTTNFGRVFDLILERAKAVNMPSDEMPTHLVVVSDMQFDIADSNGLTHMERINRLYSESGYKRPIIVFWNVRSNTTTDIPAKYNEQGVVLVSGFSTSILKMVLQGDIPTPEKLMLQTLNDEQYSRMSLPPEGMMLN